LALCRDEMALCRYEVYRQKRRYQKKVGNIVPPNS